MTMCTGGSIACEEGLGSPSGLGYILQERGSSHNACMKDYKFLVFMSGMCVYVCAYGYMYVCVYIYVCM